MPASLLGTYYDSGESSVGWYLLPAGDKFCTTVVESKQSCLKITRPGVTVDYGPMVVAGDQLLVYLIYDEANQGLFTERRIDYTIVGDSLDLHSGLSGAPRGPLIHGEPTS
jgi:hypothetical protein